MCLTPLLPLDDPERFVDRVLSFDPDVLVLQEFHDSGGGFGADTGAAARALLEECGWSTDDYRSVFESFRARRADIYEGEAGLLSAGGPARCCSGRRGQLEWIRTPEAAPCVEPQPYS